MGRFGSHAASAIPLLTQEAEFGKRADAALALIEKRKAAHSKDQGEYFPQNDPVAKEAMGAILKDAARPGNLAEKYLQFLEDENSPNPAEIKSYRRDEHPFATSMMHHMSAVGKASAKALKRIQG